MPLEALRPTLQPESPAPEQGPSDISVAELPINAPERRNRICRRIGPFAVAAVWLGASIAPHTDTISTVSELGIRNAETILNQQPQFGFQEYTADEAVLRTYQAFHLRGGYYIDNIETMSGFASTWHQYQLLNMLDIAGTLGNNPDMDLDSMINQATAAVGTYWDDSPTGYPAGYNATKNFGLGQPDRYVDDNLWLAQFLMRRYQKTGDEADANRIKEIMDLFSGQRDPEIGGAYWKVQFPTEANRDRVVVSNATAIPTLIDMYLTGRGSADYPEVAQQTFEWLQQLRDPSTGLYFDKFVGNDEIDKTFYTYVQAQILESVVHLNKIDAIRYPLAEAVEFAKLSTDYFSSQGGYGISKFDVIYLKSLMNLASSTTDAVLTESTRQAIALAKEAIPNSPTSLPDAAAAAAIIALSELPFDKWAEV